MERNHFLEKVSRNLDNKTLPNQDTSPSQHDSPATADVQTIMQKFIDEANAVKSQTHLVTDETIAIKKVLQLLNKQPNNKYISWDDTYLPVTNLVTHLSSANYERYQSNVPRKSAERMTAHIKLAEASVGITGCSAALADTGSIVLESQSGQGRLSSLLPPVHIALLTTDQIYPTMESYIKSQPEAGYRSSNLIVITGPSRTADITQTLTLGVHGPGTLHIIIIDKV
jgi:L-lactate dehydrogenase complex protein LldG